MASPACPDGVLRPGYNTPYFPYLYYDDRSQVSGIYAELFRTASAYLGCNRTEFILFPQDNSFCNKTDCINVLDGTIENGKTFTYAVSTFLATHDVFRFAYSVTADFGEKQVLVRRENTLPPPDVRLIFYTVFYYDVWLMIAFFYFTLCAMHYTRRRTQRTIRRRGLIFDYSDTTGTAAAIVGFCWLTLIYQAMYNGNNMVASSTTAYENLNRDVLQTLSNIVEGSLTILIGNSTTFSSSERSTLFGTNYEYLDDLVVRFRKMCNSSSYVTILYQPELLEFNTITGLQKTCNLQRIPDGGEKLPVASFSYSLRTGDNFYFPFEKNMSRRVIDKINFLLLTIYTYDLQQTFYTRRYVPNVNSMSQPIDSSSSFDGRPFEMIQLQLPLCFLAIGLCIAVTTLVIEAFFCPYLLRIMEDNKLRS